jgi:pimeloyl-ACP methyl ester carboxylesterase
MPSTGSGPERPARRVALALVGAALAGCAAGEDMRHERPAPEAVPEADPDADGESLVVDGAALNFVRRGAGPAVVLIHGASGNRRDWSPALVDAAAAGHTVVAIDRPGHGLSGWPGPEAVRLGEQARRMRIALARLGVRRAVLVGHSYGGSVALAWALDAPETVDGLLLIAAPSQVWQGGLGLSTDLLASPLTGPLLARAIPALLPRAAAETAAGRVFAPQAPPPDYLDRLRLDLVLRPATLRANAAQLAALKDELRPLVPAYPGLAAPVELVHGGADTTVPLAIHSAILVRQAPRARLTVLPGVGHMPHHVDPPAVLAALDRLSAA